MNRIFAAMILVAFSYAAWREVTWIPPEPVVVEAPAPPPGATSPDPAVRALAEEVARLRPAPPAAAPPRRPMEAMQDAILGKSRAAVELVLKLVGAMAFFLGLLQIAQDGGLLTTIARAIRPLMVRLFPDVPPDHPAMGAMILNLSANALGLGNAATPFGIKAMKELDRLNRHRGTATNAMALFLAINTSSVTLLPTGVIVMREALGSAEPAAVLPTTLAATLLSTSSAILAAKLYQRWARSPDDVTPPEDVVELEPLATEDAASGWPVWASALALSGLLVAIPLTVAFGAIVAPWIVPGLTAALVAYGVARGVPVYESFVAGAREGFDLAVRIIPFLVAILAAVGMLEASGALGLAVDALDGITGPWGLPGEALPMALLRPLSGSGASGVMVAIMEDPATGPDTYVGLLVSTLQGSTETTFYVLAVYFGAIGVKRVRHTLAAALTADAVGVVAAVAACTAYVAWAL